MKPFLELRILSGPALGAVIELAAGTHVIGANNACDLVLVADTSVAGRHLELQVRKQAGLPPEVFVRPLEGEIVVNGAAVAKAGVPLLQGEVLGLGFTALAWQPIGGLWGTITLAPLEFARLAVAEESAAGTVEPETAREASAVEAVKPEAAAEERPVSKTPPGAEGDIAVREAQKRMSWAGLAIAAACFLLLTLGVALGLALLPPSPKAAAQQLRTALDAAGFREIRVEPGLAHALVLRGEVEDDQELRRVLHLTQGLPFRVHVAELRVGDDLLRITRETLNAHGFFPEVRYRKGKDKDAGGGGNDNGNNDLALSLYLKDSMVETGMLATLRQDVPRLATASRKVVYAQDVAPVLEQELSRLGLEGERAVYLSGKVLLPFRLDFQARQELETALESIRTTLGVPVVFQVAADGNSANLAHSLAGGNAVPVDGSLNAIGESGGSAAPTVLGGLEVMGVTLDEIPFVTMSDQQKFFPGAVLPGGATLVGIHSDHLVFQNGAETITYPLKEMK
jgi:type III secretion protein D